MFPRYLLVVLIALAFLAGTDSLQAQSPSCSSQQQVVGQTTVCEPCAKPAPLATWWANSHLGRFTHEVARDTKRNNCWPQPFINVDRLAVRKPFVIMVANGWMRQNTLGEDHFEAETGKLNWAGQLKVRRILLEGLPQHRDLWVYRSDRPTETAARVDAVQQYASQIVRNGALPNVFETDIPAPSWSAQRVDLVEAKYIATMPDPQLPKPQQDDQAQ